MVPDRAGRGRVIVIGAGLAGLAPARDRQRHGHSVLVLEARPRIGGRILTRHVKGLVAPVELGAEFVHGEAPQTMRLLREAGMLAAPVDSPAWTAERGRLRRGGFLPTIDRVLRLVDKDRPDESLAAFL